MSDRAALVVHGARKCFGATVALDGIDLRVEAGEWVGLLGPNGAGKTTLINALCGLTRLDAGRIEIFGDGPGASVGLVPQAIALYPLLTVTENLTVFGELHGVRGRALAERRAWALDWTGLADRAGERVSRLSGGMQRRLNIACGVLHAPRLVVLDEPTVGIDPPSRERIWSMLERLRDDGATLLHSTHHLDEAQGLCDRMLVLDRGRVIAAGSLDELIAATLGGGMALCMTLDRPAPRLAARPGLACAGRELRGTLDDPVVELPAILREVAAAGGHVRGLRVERPGLSEVFARLTGRELAP